MKNIFLISFLIFSSNTSIAASQIVNDLLKTYQQQGAIAANVSRGEQLWTSEFIRAGQDRKRSCAGCHSADLKNIGKHLRTGKKIKALAPSVNPTSLSKTKKIKKWFKRNCKWTMGRECNAQEKADILLFISKQ
ncbi:MAG: DUF1924 domain-containing protein [Pseudomonadota bacterium]